MIDLHLHSNLSDGSLSPEALSALVAECGLSAAALTDHDTVAGTERFATACSLHGIRGVIGVEISVDFTPGTMHMLGYFPTCPGEAFEFQLGRIRAGRADRNRRILDTLSGLGMPLDSSRLAAISGEGVMGRPHIAQAMVESGYVPDARTAFDLYLGKGCCAYHDRFRLSPSMAVRSICDAGGVAVLAHPATLGLPPGQLREVLELLCREGLAGLEVLYPEYAEPQRQLYSTLARERGLVITGGSDFHGALNPDIRPGRGFGNIRIPDRVLEELERLSGRCFGQIEGGPGVGEGKS